MTQHIYRESSGISSSMSATLCHHCHSPLAARYLTRAKRDGAGASIYECRFRRNKFSAENSTLPPLASLVSADSSVCLRSSPLLVFGVDCLWLLSVKPLINAWTSVTLLEDYHSSGPLGMLFEHYTNLLFYRTYELTVGCLNTFNCLICYSNRRGVGCATLHFCSVQLHVIHLNRAGIVTKKGKVIMPYIPWLMLSMIILNMHAIFHQYSPSSSNH